MSVNIFLIGGLLMAVFVIVVFFVVGGILLTAISRTARGSKDNTYGSGHYQAGSSTFVEPNALEMMDSGIDPAAVLVDAAFDAGYITSDDDNDRSLPGVDPGAVDQQGTDLGAFGSCAIDTTPSSDTGWDAGASIGTDMSSSTFTGSTDSGMSGAGIDSGSSGM